jgi:hypothetical protein
VASLFLLNTSALKDNLGETTFNLFQQVLSVALIVLAMATFAMKSQDIESSGVVNESIIRSN